MYILYPPIWLATVLSSISSWMNHGYSRHLNDSNVLRNDLRTRCWEVTTTIAMWYCYQLTFMLGGSFLLSLIRHSTGDESRGLGKIASVLWVTTSEHMMHARTHLNVPNCCSELSSHHLQPRSVLWQMFRYRLMKWSVRMYKILYFQLMLNRMRKTNYWSQNANRNIINGLRYIWCEILVRTLPLWLSVMFAHKSPKLDEPYRRNGSNYKQRIEEVKQVYPSKTLQHKDIGSSFLNTLS